MNRPSLVRFALLSAIAAILTIGLKTVAYFLTGSVGLLSDALESLVNLVGAVMAMSMLTIAARPPDEDHNYGHDKAEYFSSGVEGSLILVAALGIGVAAYERLLAPRPLEQIGLGLGVSVVASLINFVVARILFRVGRQHNSITLEANAHHLMTDVWTSAGVLAAVGAVSLTGWNRLDPIIALIVAVNIVRTGVRLMRQSIAGLMDVALPEQERDVVLGILEKYRREGIEYHKLHTRRAGARRFVSVHVLVPHNWTIKSGHKMLERIEGEIRGALPNVTAFTHMEPFYPEVSDMPGHSPAEF
jgi:cation diffusion facilitator family transporter